MNLTDQSTSTVPDLLDPAFYVDLPAMHESFRELRAQGPLARRQERAVGGARPPRDHRRGAPRRGLRVGPGLPLVLPRRRGQHDLARRSPARRAAPAGLRAASPPRPSAPSSRSSSTASTTSSPASSRPVELEVVSRARGAAPGPPHRAPARVPRGELGRHHVVVGAADALRPVGHRRDRGADGVHVGDHGVRPGPHRDGRGPQGLPGRRPRRAPGRTPRSTAARSASRRSSTRPAWSSPAAPRPPARSSPRPRRPSAEHPDQWEALAADPSLVPGAVEELIRWVTPLNNFFRTATADDHDRRARPSSRATA